MYKLTIITINLNNAAGLEQTMQSVLSQTRQDIEYVVVDGASTDGSVEVVRHFADLFGERMKWVSEPDAGIYNAMNKGIRMAAGEYLQFLNSGDYLAADDVAERMLAELERSEGTGILYGNRVNCYPDGRKVLRKNFQGREITMLDMYKGSFFHSPTYIRRDLFGKYGLYDESLRIVSDWKWFVQAVIQGGEKPKYADITVTMFDMGGISNTDRERERHERQAVLADLFPETIVKDYERYYTPIELFQRLQRHQWAYRLVCLLDRCLRKLEYLREKKK